MSYVYLVLNWFFAVMFLLIGAVSLFKAPLAGLSMIAASGLLLPPLREFVHSKTNRVLLTKARAVSIFVLVMAFGSFMGDAAHGEAEEQRAREAQVAAERVAQQRQDNVKYFNINREEIMSSARSAFSRKDYQSIVSESSKYLAAGDKELEQIHTQAKEQLAAIQKAATTEKLLSELKGIKTTEVEKLMKLYQQLLTLHPSNETYATKVAFYTSGIESEKQERITAEARKKRIESQFSGWDGAHRNLERVVKDAMNDPDSYSHVETTYWDRGDHLVVQITFRGKNGFGGIVKNSVKAKVDLDGKVLQIVKQN